MVTSSRRRWTGQRKLWARWGHLTLGPERPAGRSTTLHVYAPGTSQRERDLLRVSYGITEGTYAFWAIGAAGVGGALFGLRDSLLAMVAAAVVCVLVCAAARHLVLQVRELTVQVDDDAARGDAVALETGVAALRALDEDPTLSAVEYERRWARVYDTLPARAKAWPASGDW